ncbi:MAG: acyl-CoA synthetase FdrA [Deltaproteobacteria bacterium]|nr:acyl-CoA synthetase FdrA [Deltaproteobacteria bacterium]
MTMQAIVRKNQYHDSVRLMTISRQAGSLEGVNKILALMGTEGNKKVLKDLGLYNEMVDSATPNDLVVCVDADTGDGFNSALKKVDDLLKSRTHGGPSEDRAARSLEEAVEQMPDANFALISVPGEFAALEVMGALEKDINVMLFSDNVSIEDEVFLKDLAMRKGLLMMGPDCGTAVINGIPFAFANMVRRGDVGIVGASGTGIQEVSCLIHRLGGGISHAIGVGGRDLSLEVGGRMMVTAIRKLAGDPSTKSLVLISKSGAPDSTRRVLTEAKKSGLPTVICLLGKGNLPGDGGGLTFVNTLEDAAYRTAGKDKPEYGADEDLTGEIGRLSEERKYLRGLYSGGTLCYEALLIFKEAMKVHSNIGTGRKYTANGPRNFHYCLDLGDDEFTRSRPHPMIDSTLRREFFIQAYSDPKTRVVLLDVVLGYGASADPAGDMVAALGKARAHAFGEGPVVMAHVCGTDEDPQSMKDQESKLREAGVFLFSTNAEAARAAMAAIISLS